MAEKKEKVVEPTPPPAPKPEPKPEPKKVNVEARAAAAIAAATILANTDVIPPTQYSKWIDRIEGWIMKEKVDG